MMGLALLRSSIRYVITTFGYNNIYLYLLLNFGLLYQVGTILGLPCVFRKLDAVYTIVVDVLIG